MAAEESSQSSPAVVVIGSEVDIASPEPAPLQDDSVLLEGGCGNGDRGESGTSGGGRMRPPGESVAVSQEEKKDGDPERLQRFYFESDALVLKNNIDYQKMLKALSLLEAQKIQATKDLEKLMIVKNRALCDPLGFVTALKNGTLEALPMRQHIAELPDINWQCYIDSVEKIVKQHSSVYQRTRRKVTSGKEAATLTKIESTKLKGGEGFILDKPPSYKKPWTTEEQMRLEELLKTYPPESIERRRYEKIANALGTRTTQQVASHIQKYFIKLAKAGLPVPGRMPNMAAYTSKGKKGNRLKRLSRPSTFFSTLAPRVLMSSGVIEGERSSPTGSTQLEEDEEGEDDETDSHKEEEGGDVSSDSDDSILMTGECTPITDNDAPSSSDHQPPNISACIKCVRCKTMIECGQYWMCCECPATSQVILCPDCINSEYQTEQHCESHEMMPHTFSTTTGASDEDYTQFTQNNSNAKYNYLDPNFYPAS